MEKMAAIGGATRGTSTDRFGSAVGLVDRTSGLQGAGRRQYRQSDLGLPRHASTK